MASRMASMGPSEELSEVFKANNIGARGWGGTGGLQPPSIWEFGQIWARFKIFLGTFVIYVYSKLTFLKSNMIFSKVLRGFSWTFYHVFLIIKGRTSSILGDLAKKLLPWQPFLVFFKVKLSNPFIYTSI